MACNVSTGSMMFLLTRIGPLLLLSVSMGKAGSLRCPPLAQVEIGTDGVIACDVGFKFVNLYWYSGDSFSETPPIVKLEDGAPESGDGFDISTNGSLIVLGADASREGIFTIVVFHLNNSYEHSSVSLETFANPKPDFPLINRCNGKQSCSLKADDKGSVQCSIYDARPAFEIDLQSDGVTLINITHENVTDANTGLTNTFTKAYYESTQCVHLANITCIATGKAKDKIKSTLTFHDDCPPIVPTGASGKGSGGVAVVIVLVIIVIIAVAVVVTIYFIRRRQDYQRVKQNDVEDTRIKLSVEENKEILLRALSEKYRDDYFGNTSDEDDRKISIDDVYIDLDFEIKDGSSGVKTFKIDKMFTAPFSTDQKRRLFVSNKMQLTFSSYFAYQWSEQETQDNILLVFNMLDVSCNNDIITLIKQMLPGQSPLSEDDLFKVIEQFGCHIVLDGVEVKHIVSRSENETSSENVAHGDVDLSSKLTVKNILRDQERKIVPKNIFQWVIIYDRDSVMSTDGVPYDIVLIKELTLSFVDCFDNYIDTVVDYYCRLSPDETKKGVKTAVKEVLSQCELRKKFERALVLLMQMTHLVTNTCLNNADTSTAAGISSLLIQSMSLLKMRYLKKFPLHEAESLTFLEERLGEVAFNQLMGKANIKPNVSEEMIKFSKSIGLITQSSSAEKILFPAICVKYFVSACFIKDKEFLSSFIDQTIQSEDDGINDERFQILPFICAIQPSYSHQICEKILKKGRMNYFLNCFCETSNADEFHGVIKKYVEKNDFVIIVYNHKPHLAKVSCLLKYCNKWEITVSRMKFDRISQTSSKNIVVRTEIFQMPAVEKILFNRLPLNEEETFLYYIEWLMKQNVKIVSFADCNLPEFSSNVNFALKDIFSKSTSKVVFKRIETENDAIHRYDLSKGEIKWIIKSTDKINKKKEKDTKGGHHDKENAKGRSSEENTAKKQTKYKTTDQAPDKPSRKKTTDNKPELSQSEIAADVTGDGHSETSTGNNKQPSQDQKFNDKDESVSKNATKPEDVKIMRQIEDSTDVITGEKSVVGESKGQYPGMEKPEEKKADVVSGEEDVSNKDATDRGNLKESNNNGTLESEGNGNDPNAK